MQRSWFGLNMAPCYDGFYDVKFADGTERRIEFRDGVWIQLGFTHWSGQMVLLPKNEFDGLRKLLSSASIAARHKEVREAALRLARHYVVKNRTIPAVTCYQIAFALGGELEPVDFDQLANRFAKLSEKGRSRVEEHLSNLAIEGIESSRKWYLGIDS